MNWGNRVGNPGDLPTRAGMPTERNWMTGLILKTVSNISYYLGCQYRIKGVINLHIKVEVLGQRSNNIIPQIIGLEGIRVEFDDMSKENNRVM